MSRIAPEDDEGVFNPYAPDTSDSIDVKLPKLIKVIVPYVDKPLLGFGAQGRDVNALGDRAMPDLRLAPCHQLYLG